MDLLKSKASHPMYMYIMVHLEQWHPQSRPQFHIYLAFPKQNGRNNPLYAKIQRLLPTEQHEQFTVTGCPSGSNGALIWPETDVS